MNRATPRKRDDGLGYVEQSIFPQVFGANHAAVFAYKKTQRVSAALHLVTDALPENEPMRSELRAEALGMVRDALILGTHPASSHARQGCSQRLTRIITLLDVARTAAIVSEMNAAVLMRECSMLDRLYAGISHGQETDFDPFFFEVGGVGPQAAGEHAETPRSVKDIKDKKTEKDTETREQKEYKKDKSQTNNRRTTILELARNKGRINVKDVSNVIVDCSEKTIQRELLALVREGVLKKEGERRWSTYLLAD